MSVSRPVALTVLAPSFLSLFVSLIAAVALIAWVLLPFFYRGSYMERYGEVLISARGDRDIFGVYAIISSELNSSDLVGNIAVFCVWAIAGLAIYYLIVSLLSLVMDLVRFAQILGYENSDKKSIVIEAVERLTLRTLGVVGFGMFVAITLQLIVPAILTLVAASFSSLSVMAAVYLIASVVFTMAVLHIVVVLLRVIFLRTRLIFRDYNNVDAW
jgi:hypothetical protein